MENKTSKICNICKENKNIDSFNKNKQTKDGKAVLCKDCYKKNLNRIKQEKKDGVFQSKCRTPRLTDAEKEERRIQQLSYLKQYRQDNKTELRAKLSVRLNQSKMDGIKFYGGKCQCCGEANHKFLTLEHLNGRDKSKKKRTGKLAWDMARVEGYPDTYTVLCFNCNCAKGIYGMCPHMENKNESK